LQQGHDEIPNFWFLPSVNLLPHKRGGSCLGSGQMYRNGQGSYWEKMPILNQL
jgi:hypothetical protein